MAELRAETRYAKQLFLYGNGDGRPVRSVVTLSKLAGVHVETIRKYVSAWEQEAEGLLAGSSDCGLALSLSKKQLEQNTKDLDFARDQINKIKFEISALDKMAERLGEWMDKFDGDDVQTALDIFSDWQKSTGHASALRSQFIAMKKLWDEKSAIDGLRDVALTREKEISKGKAKLSIKALEAEQGASTPRVVGGGIFARPDQSVRPLEIEIGE